MQHPPSWRIHLQTALTSIIFFYTVIYHQTFWLFSFLAIVNTVAVNMGAQFSLSDHDFNSFRCILEVGLLDHIYGSSAFTFLRHFQCLYQLHPHQPHTRIPALFSTSSPTLVRFWLFGNSHPGRCEVIPHGPFDLHFPDDWSCWAAFHVGVGHLQVFFGEMPLQILCQFLIRLLLLSFFATKFSAFLIGFWINLLSDMWFAIFSNSIVCLFTLVIIFFAVQKILSLIR